MSDIIEKVINAAFPDHEDPRTATATATATTTATAGATTTVGAAPELTPFMDALKVPPTLRPTGGGETGHVEIELKASWVRMHSQLPPTLVWAYDGHFPGPTIEVRRRQRIRVAWKNRLSGPYPVTSVAVPQGPADDPNTNRPGRDGVKPDEDVAALPAWAVTHLHGAVTGGGNDGWAENAVGAGDAQLSEYPNDHRATQWWYHDHALNITRWNVYAGLVGSYLIRDDAEDALGLPSGDQELPLILSDRNFDTDDEGRLDGRLLHKVINLGPDEESGKDVTLPFDGPYTTVNGTVWPYLDAEPRWYRFRLLNASNARTYELALVDEEGRPVPDGTVKQIGSDGGLLPHPVDIRFSEKPDNPAYPDDPGVLPVAPAERLDLLVDFRALRGRRLRLVDTGTTGFGNPDPAQKVPFPQVMEFRVGTDPVADPFVLPGTLAPAFRRLTHDIPHGHRLIVLTAPGTKGGGGHPEIWEMEEVEEDEESGGRAVAAGDVVVPSDGTLQIRGSGDKVPRTYRRIARMFDDVLGIRIPEGEHEQWSFLNLGAPMHPMHIHMTDFQILSRELFDISGFAPEIGGTRSPLEFRPDEPVTVAPNERGWKEVFRVPEAQMVNVMGRFSGAYGRFMYHCHLLEHEDAGMMRPFIAVPPEALKFDHGGAGGGHGGH